MVLSRYLDECAARAAGVLGEELEASVTLRENGLTLRAGSSAAASARCDQAEAMADDGPCIDAMNSGSVVDVPAVEAGERWEEWSAQTLDEGFVRALAVPSQVSPGIAVALNIYSRHPGTWDERLLVSAAAYSRLVASAVRLQLEFADLDAVAGEFVHDTFEIATLERAVGAVMQTNGCSREAAEELLRSAAQRRGIPANEVAASALRSLASRSSGDIVDEQVSGR